MSSKNAPDPTRSAAGRQAPRPWSLAARLTAWYAISAFTLTLAATGFLYWVLMTSLVREDDQFLADEADILRVLLRDRQPDAEALRQEVEWESAARRYAHVYIRILDEGGHASLETPGMNAILPPAAFPRPGVVDPEPGADVRSPAGTPFRVLTAWTNGGPAGGTTYTLQLALDNTHQQGLLARYRGFLWLVLGISLLACTLGGYRIARQGIRPVEDIARAARRIRSTTLDERIEANRFPAELAALAGTFNEMLNRLEDSFARLSRFSADIAHELRTPVTNLRGEAEVALSKPRSEEEYREVLGSCLEEYTRLTRMVDSLLFLARAEDPKNQISRDRVNVAPELEAVQEFYEAAATEAGVRLGLNLNGPVFASLDRSLFRRAVGNLVENALAHTPAGGLITLSAAQEGNAVRVEVTDTGCGISGDHIPHLFDRFYRVDQARSSTGGRLGLGLAIVKGIAELHGGSVAITSETGRGTCATLIFPAETVSPGGPRALPEVGNMTKS